MMSAMNKKIIAKQASSTVNQSTGNIFIKCFAKLFVGQSIKNIWLVHSWKLQQLCQTHLSSVSFYRLGPSSESLGTGSIKWKHSINHWSSIISLPSSTGSTAGLPKVNSSMLVTSLQELWQENYLMIIVAAICWHSPLSTEARVGGGWHSGLRQQRIFTSQTDRVVLTEARWDCTMTTLTHTTWDTEQCPDQRHEALSSSSDFSENHDFMFYLFTIYHNQITKFHTLYSYVI